MFKDTPGFSSFSTDNMDAAEKFYGQTLGLELKRNEEGLDIKLGNRSKLLIYQSRSKEFKAPEFTCLYFVVDDVEKTVEKLNKKGVKMEIYEGEFGTDQKGILRNDGRHPGPPAIAWFKDPAGHVLAVMQEK